MNLLFLLGVYPDYGGVEKVTTILSNEFAKRGYGISIVSFEQPKLHIAEEELDKRIILFKLDKPVYCSDNVKRLNKIITEHCVDVIINQWVVPYYVTRLCRHAMRGTSCKLVSVHHNLPDTNARIKDVEIAIEQNPNKRWLLEIKLLVVRTVSRLSLRYAYDKCDRFVVLAPSFISVLGKFIKKRHLNKAVNIFNTITIDEVESICTNKQKEILFVGRIEDNQKRTQRIVDVWKLLEPNFSDWKMTIVGDGPNRCDLQRRIEEEKLKNIKIVGFQNPVRYFDRASLLILVSEYEGFGLVVVEAMSRGAVPVVLGSYSAIYDMVEDGHGAFISPYPFDSNKFAEKLQMLMNDDNLLRRMEKEAVNSTKIFGRNAIVAEWEKLLSDIKSDVN